MPRSLDPSARLTIVLASDLDKPPETQPRFYAMHLTANQQRRLAVGMEQMKAATTPEQKIMAAINAAMICLVGWENMVDPVTGADIPFNADTLGDVLDVEELAEVIGFVASASTATPADKKKSELQPSSAAGNSANHARGSAEKSSASSSQPKSNAQSVTQTDAVSVTTDISKSESVPAGTSGRS